MTFNTKPFDKLMYHEYLTHMRCITTHQYKSTSKHHVSNNRRYIWPSIIYNRLSFIALLLPSNKYTDCHVTSNMIIHYHMVIQSCMDQYISAP